MKTIIELLAIFVLPVFLINFNILSKKYRFHLLGLVAFLVFTVICWQRWSLTKLGLSINNFFNELLVYFLFTIIGVILIILLAKILGHTKIDEWQKHPHFMYGFILVSIPQEFLYRAFLMPQLQNIFSNVIIIVLINAILFSLLHIIYPNKLINLSASFIAGLFFALIYYYYPNFILICLSHAVLNFMAVKFSFFVYHDDFITE